MSPLPISALLFALALPQSTATPSSSTATFHSDALHFDYSYGSTFQAMPSIATQAIQSEEDKATGAVPKAAVSCISLPLTATDSTAGFRMISIMRLDGACLGRPTTPAELSPLAVSSLTQSLRRLGEPQVGAADFYELADHSAAVVSGSVKSDKYGSTLYAMVSCMVQGGDAVCWEFMASKCSALPELMAYPLQFDGQPGLPLIPARFAQPCKP